MADRNNTAHYRGGICVPDKTYGKGLAVGDFDMLIMLVVPGTRVRDSR